jgi:hypothetical protein
MSEDALTKTSPDLTGFALHEKVDALVLIGQDVEESIFEFGLFAVTGAGNGDTLAFPGSGIFFDEVLDIVVVDVVYAPLWSVMDREGE